MHGPLVTNDLHHESINTYRIKKFLRTQRNIEEHCGLNGTTDITGRTRRSAMSARGHNGTADTKGYMLRPVVSAVPLCPQTNFIVTLCPHADTTERLCYTLNYAHINHT